MTRMPNSLSPCARGWHRVDAFGELEMPAVAGESEPVAGATGPTYVRFGARIGGEHPAIVYRFGPRPDDGACRTLWDYESKGEPWICDACGRPISGWPPLGRSTAKSGLS
jgi:hypothetical protein